MKSTFSIEKLKNILSAFLYLAYVYMYVSFYLFFLIYFFYFNLQCNSWEIMPVNRKHQIFILLCLHFTSVQSDFERVCNSQTDLRGPDPQGICGRLIPEMLHLVCGGQYYVPSKRDVSSLSHHKQDSNVGMLSILGSVWTYFIVI